MKMNERMRTAPTRSGHAVLLVEDDPDVAQLFTEAATALGVPLVWQSSGEDAQRWLEDNSARLIYVDYRLPGINGTEFIQQACQRFNTLPPFIIMTGAGNEFTAVEALRLGALDYIVKDRQEKQVILDAIGEAVYGVDENGRVGFVNAAMEALLGWKAAELVGKPIHDIIHMARPDGSPYPAAECPLYQAYRAGHQLRVGDQHFFHRDGHRLPVECTSTPLVLDGKPAGAVVVFHDLTERQRTEQAQEDHIAQLKDLNRRLEEAQNQLLQSEKMASIGLLAAGIAHEINNPVGYVQSNLKSLERYLTDLLQVLDAYEHAEAQSCCPEECLAQVRQIKQRVDIPYLREDVASLMRESEEGISRVRKIIQDLKDFSHVGQEETWQEADLHRSLESTLNVVWNELKYKARVVREYGELPEIRCIPSQLNQVFMNLLINAAQAIEDKGTITIRTGLGTGAAAGEAWVEIEDDGKGIPPENLKKIFDPFFTTKPIGKGTGLGLSVSHGIVQKHGGHIEVASREGQGTRFRIWLPVAGGPAQPGKPT